MSKQSQGDTTSSAYIFHRGITFSSLELFILNRVPLEGAQTAVLLGIYKSWFLGFLALTQLVMALILIFLLALAGLFVCLFVFPPSLYLEFLQAERLLLNELVVHHPDAILMAFVSTAQRFTALLLTSWPNMTYHTIVKPALNNSFQVIKIDVVESGNPRTISG